MMTTFQMKFDNRKEIGKEAVELAKGLLSEEIPITPYNVARFNYLAGYPNVEVFAHTNSVEAFNDEDDYEENIYYYLYETGDIIRVTFGELERLAKVTIEYELDRGIYISQSERAEYEEVIRS